MVFEWNSPVLWWLITFSILLKLKTLSGGCSNLAQKSSITRVSTIFSFIFRSALSTLFSALFSTAVSTLLSTITGTTSLTFSSSFLNNCSLISKPNVNSLELSFSLDEPHITSSKRITGGREFEIFLDFTCNYKFYLSHSPKTVKNLMRYTRIIKQL